MTFSTLKKQAQAAPKYVLQIKGRTLFLSDNQSSLSGCNLTENISEAREFSVGFDRESMKTGMWNAILGTPSFEVKYL